jgi:hypothetical protein
MTKDPFPWAEISLAKKLGVGREVLPSLRKQLPKRRDWTNRCKSIQWSEEAAQEAARRTGAVLTDEHETPVLDSLVNEKLAAFIVTRVPVNPPGVMAGRKSTEGIEVNITHGIRTKDNANFLPGMELEPVPSDRGWTLVGPCPPYRGIR